MSYLVTHHGSYWFRIRVPARHVGCYGRVVRINLQTTERAIARTLSLRLAAEWLSRFCDCAEARPTELTAFPPPPDEALPPPACPPVPAAAPRPLKRARKPDVVVSGPAPAARSLSALLTYWKALHPTSAASTVIEMRHAVRMFERQCRKPVTDIQRADIVAFRDTLIGEGRARTTVAKKVGFVGTLLQLAFDGGEIAVNVARGLRIPQAKIEPVSRSPFGVEELRRIFGSAIYTKGLRPRGGGGEAIAWVPMLALATGARLEELCQLKTDDLIIDDASGPYLRISDESGGRVKTNSSRRSVPLHPALIEAGLLDYHRRMQAAGHAYLFPELDVDHDGRRGAYFGKMFMRWLRSHEGCAIREPKFVFHSFRHTFKTLCREAGISEEIHDGLTGHANGSVGRSYGVMPLRPLAQAVAAIRFPIALPRIPS